MNAWPWAKSNPIGAEGYYGSGEDELHLVFNFALFHQRWKAQAFHDVVQAWYDKLPDGAWPCWVLNNHDNRRSISRYAAGEFTEARAKVAATMLLTLRGTPFLYYGEELGLPEGKIPRAEIVDPPGRKYWPIYKGRDGCRTPMPWDATTNAGFSTGQPWLPVNPDYARVNVESERRDPNSLLNYYRAVARAASCVARSATRRVSRAQPNRRCLCLRTRHRRSTPVDRAEFLLTPDDYQHRWRVACATDVGRTYRI